MFQVFSDADLCAVQLDRSIRIGVLCQSSQHSDVTVRLFESGTRVIERARLKSTLDVGVWKFHSTSRRFHTGCHTQRDQWTRVEVSPQVSREVWLQM